MNTQKVDGSDRNSESNFMDTNNNINNKNNIHSNSYSKSNTSNQSVGFDLSYSRRPSLQQLNGPLQVFDCISFDGSGNESVWANVRLASPLLAEIYDKLSTLGRPHLKIARRLDIHIKVGHFKRLHFSVSEPVSFGQFIERQGTKASFIVAHVGSRFDIEEPSSFPSFVVVVVYGAV